MSEQEYYRKEDEEEGLQYFIEAYNLVVEEPLRENCIAHERPDFICSRSDGTMVGVELVKVMRDPRDAFAVEIVLKDKFMEGEEALEFLYNMIDRKAKKIHEPDWHLPDDTILVLQLVDCPISYLHLTADLQSDFESYGFSEIWIVDYTEIEAYYDVELFCLYPKEWWGYYQRPNPTRKPYA